MVYNKIIYNFHVTFSSFSKIKEIVKKYEIIFGTHMDIHHH